MGGMNHQPCREYLPVSTRMSRSFSAAFGYLFQANICLEAVLLDELADLRGQLGPLLNNLRLSSSYIEAFQLDIVAVRSEMDERGYKDLPPLQSLDLETIGESLAAKGAVNLESWRKMSALMKSETFYATLGYFEHRAKDLNAKTNNLHKMFTGLADFVSNGTLHEVLEENKPGNVKIAFAQLITSWTSFLNDFLASSLVSTEVWYAHSGAASLIPSKEEKVST